MQKALSGKTASSLLTRQRENDRALGNVGRSFFLFVVFIFSRFQHPKCTVVTIKVSKLTKNAINVRISTIVIERSLSSPKASGGNFKKCPPDTCFTQ